MQPTLDQLFDSMFSDAKKQGGLYSLALSSSRGEIRPNPVSTEEILVEAAQELEEESR